MEIWLLILFGFLGGIVRIIVGLLKNKVLSGKQKFMKGKFLFTLICSGIIGAFCALLLMEDYRIVLLAGYAGSDLIQGIYKMATK